MHSDYSIEPEMNIILSDLPAPAGDSLLSGLLGFLGGIALPNPISWLLEPFIQLWTIQAEIKRIRLKEKQVTLAADVAKKKIDSLLEFEISKLRTQYQSFEEKIAKFENLISLHDNQTEVFMKSIEAYNQQLDQESNPLIIVSIHTTLQILYEGLSGSFANLCNSYDKLFFQINTQIESRSINNERLLDW